MSSASKALLETLSSVLKHAHIRNGFDHVLKDVRYNNVVNGSFTNVDLGYTTLSNSRPRIRVLGPQVYTQYIQ